MKEVRFFYVPNADSMNELPEEEAQHAVRVLRMEMGDEMMLMDGQGTFYRTVVTEATKKRCLYRIEETLPQERQWAPHLHLAMAPTKNMDRTEWFAEKATEIGFDELTFLNCRWSERTVIKTERVDKILVSAMKQSRKAWKPILNEMTDFKTFMKQVEQVKAQKFICHCYEEEGLGEKKPLKDVLKRGEDAIVLVGPEGDFSIDEVKQAEAMGFQSVTLGKSRLRTETAALVAVHIMNLMNQ
ncbi:MAG: 16S rRNA (uracil(1498)-N(3))-methyltransferase [Bacteroidaceae bacterium]|nr:16S rRNA (uracil(1498)-N(3))-methyltransferase [Bacteroidaceae bacterium]